MQNICCMFVAYKSQQILFNNRYPIVEEYELLYTVMVKNIGTPALLPEECCNYKCFGINMFI